MNTPSIFAAFSDGPRPLSRRRKKRQRREDDLMALADATRERRYGLPTDAELDQLLTAWGDRDH